MTAERFALGLMLFVLVCALIILATVTMFKAQSPRLTPVQKDWRVAAASLLYITALPLGSIAFALLGAR